MTTSRSRQVYMKNESKPASWPATPSQSRWLWMRSSSETRVPMAEAVLAIDVVFSAARDLAIAFERSLASSRDHGPGIFATE